MQAGEVGGGIHSCQGVCALQEGRGGNINHEGFDIDGDGRGLSNTAQIGKRHTVSGGGVWCCYGIYNSRIT